MGFSDADMGILSEYKSSLNDLDFNSKPMINMLTMLAEDNESLADGIVNIIKERIIQNTMKIKLPSLYLLDSILKNVGGGFIEIIAKHMIDIFTNVFEKGDEKVRMSLFKLRNTWPQYFPAVFLQELDLAVKELDPNWPVAEVPSSSVGSIHINPKFFVKTEQGTSSTSEDKAAEISLKTKLQKERLLAEEQRIQEQLKILKEEQQRIKDSRIEEERIARERILKTKQMEREMMIKEQQKQIDALKKLQKEQQASFISLKMGKPSSERLKQNNPRLNTDMPSENKEKLKSIKAEKEKLQAIKKSDRVELNEASKGQTAKDNPTHAERVSRVESNEGEPVAKKRKPDDGTLKLGTDEKKPPGNDRVETSVASKVSENIDEIHQNRERGVASNGQEKIPMVVSEDKKAIEQMPKADIESSHPVENGKLIEELRKRLESGEITKEAHDALVKQISSMYQVVKRPLPKNGNDVPMDISSDSKIETIAKSIKEDSNHDSKLDDALLSKKRNTDMELTEVKAIQGTIAGSDSQEPVSSGEIKSSSVGDLGKGQDPSRKADTEAEKQSVLTRSTDNSSTVPIEKRDVRTLTEVSELKTVKCTEESNNYRKSNDDNLMSMEAGEVQDRTRRFHQELHPKESKENAEIVPHVAGDRNEDTRDRHRPDLKRSEAHFPPRQGQIGSQMRGRGVMLRRRGKRRTPPLDSSDRPSDDTMDHRMRKMSRRAFGENYGTRRGFRPSRGGMIRDDSQSRENPLRPDERSGEDIRSERIPRDIDRASFRGSGRTRFIGPSRRMMGERYGRQRFVNESRRYMETSEARNFPGNRQYQYHPDYHESRPFRSKPREQSRYEERGDDDYPYEQRQRHTEFYDSQFRDHGDLPRSQEGYQPRSGFQMQSRDLISRTNEDSRPYYRDNLEHGEDRLTPYRENESFRGHFNEQSFRPHHDAYDERFDSGYRDQPVSYFEWHLPSDVRNPEMVHDRRNEPDRYGYDRPAHPSASDDLYSKAHDVSQAGDSGDKSATQNAVPSKANDLMAMLKNIVKGDKSVANREVPTTEARPTQLLEGLVSAGVLSSSLFASEASASPPPNIDTVEEKVPEVGFVMEDLKVRHDTVVNGLYSGTQCGTCGLRFTQEDKKFYSDHHDWHFRTNRIGKDGKSSASRSWYHFREIWIDMDDVTDFEEQAKSSVFEQEKNIQGPVVSTNVASCEVLRDDEVCGICFEPFEQFWDEALEEWRYNDAIRIDGVAYHVNCHDDVGSGIYSDEELPIDNGSMMIEVKKEPEDDYEKQENKFDEDLGNIQEATTCSTDKSAESSMLLDSTKEKDGIKQEVTEENDIKLEDVANDKNDDRQE